MLRNIASRLLHCSLLSLRISFIQVILFSKPRRLPHKQWIISSGYPLDINAVDSTAHTSTSHICIQFLRMQMMGQCLQQNCRIVSAAEVQRKRKEEKERESCMDCYVIYVTGNVAKKRHRLKIFKKSYERTWKILSLFLS